MTKCQQETRQSLKDPARRDLIAGAAGAVGLVVFGGFIGHSTVSEASLVRPLEAPKVKVLGEVV